MPGKSTRYPMGRKPVRSHSRYGRFIDETCLLPVLGNERWFFIRPTCSLITTPTELSQLVWKSYSCNFPLIVLGFSLTSVVPHHFLLRQNLYTWKAYVNLYQTNILLHPLFFNGRCRWPCALRRGSEAAWILRWWVRIPLKHDVLPLCLLCAVYVAASATVWSLVQRSATRCVCLIVCDHETSTVSWRRPEFVCCAPPPKFIFLEIAFFWVVTSFLGRTNKYKSLLWIER